MTTGSYGKQLREAMGDALVISAGVDAIVRNEQREILLIRRSDGGTWDLPGGAVEPGETPSEALLREIREETGLDVRIVRVAGVFGGKTFRHTYPDGNRIEAFSVTFECEITGGKLASRDGEATGFRFVKEDAMPPLTWPYPPDLFRHDRAGCVYL
jgi:mutator protein MutT